MTSDPATAGQSWADQQEAAFAGWVAAYSGVAPDHWDFGLVSLDLLSYLLLHRFESAYDVQDPVNAGFTEPATWYLGEVVRRADPKRQRWALRVHGVAEGRYVVEPTAKTRAWEAVNPRSHLASAVYHGDPQWLRAWYTRHSGVLWDKPWPPTSDTTGAWVLNPVDGQWHSQCGQWLESIEYWLTELAARLPAVALDYSLTSLHHVEQLAVGVAADDPGVRSMVSCYLGECLLNAGGGGRWIWDNDPERLTCGYPVVDHTDIARVSPTHVYEYARAWRDGQTFARLHRGWLNRIDELRGRGFGSVERPRQPRPGLGVAGQPDVGVLWAARAGDRFNQWAQQYGAGRNWDFSPDSLDTLAAVVVEHCPPGRPIAQSAPTGRFVASVTWYFGEVLRRGKPSQWFYHRRPDADRFHKSGLMISSLREHDGHPLAVFPLQTLDQAVTQPQYLRRTYERWVSAGIRDRIEESQKRRAKVKRRQWRTLSDDDFLQRWLTERRDAFGDWRSRYGGEMTCDFSIDSLDGLEAMVWQVADGPEELLEDSANVAFIDGAAYYLGEVLLRHGPQELRWRYLRGDVADFSEPTVEGTWWLMREPANILADIYIDVARMGGVLRRRYERAREYVAECIAITG